MLKTKYRFTQAKAKFLREMLQRLGQVVPELVILKANGTLLYFGKDEEDYEIGLAPCLQKPHKEEGIPPKTFHRDTLSKLIEYDSIFEGRELSYLIDLLQTLNFLIRHTAGKDPSRIGAQLSKQGVIEFDYPENRKDAGFKEWFEEGMPRKPTQPNSHQEVDAIEPQAAIEIPESIDFEPRPSPEDAPIIPTKPMTFPTSPVLDRLGDYGWLRLYTDLLNAFPKTDAFEQMLEVYVGVNPEIYSSPQKPHGNRVLDTVTGLNSEGRIGVLVSGAVQAKPQSPHLQHWLNWLEKGMA